VRGICLGMSRPLTPRPLAPEYRGEGSISKEVRNMVRVLVAALLGAVVDGVALRWLDHEAGAE
jgi:hypothetical protein